MKNKQSGYGILMVVLMTIVLGAVLAASLAGASSTTSMMANNNASQMIVAQAALIRSRILQCGTDYPTGNNATAYRTNYPAAATVVNVSALTCPGSSLNLWAQSDGVTMPTQTSGFGAWQYTNDVTSMRLSITSTTSDRAGIVPQIIGMLGSQSSQSGASPTITLSWVLAN